MDFRNNATLSVGKIGFCYRNHLFIYMLGGEKAPVLDDNSGPEIESQFCNRFVYLCVIAFEVLYVRLHISLSRILLLSTLVLSSKYVKCIISS